MRARRHKGAVVSTALRSPGLDAALSEDPAACTVLAEHIDRMQSPDQLLKALHLSNPLMREASASASSVSYKLATMLVYHCDAASQFMDLRKIKDVVRLVKIKREECLEEKVESNILF